MLNIIPYMYLVKKRVPLSHNIQNKNTPECTANADVSFWYCIAAWVATPAASVAVISGIRFEKELAVI